MIQKRRVFIIIMMILILMGIYSCSLQRNKVTFSLPNDDSWFTRAKKIALTRGMKDNLLGYLWISKKIYINAEVVYYTISYNPPQSTNVPFPHMVTMTRKHGSLTRSISYNEDSSEYVVSDSDFLDRSPREIITKERAEVLAYEFFKDLDKYDLYF